MKKIFGILLIASLFSCKKTDIYPDSGRIDSISWNNNTNMAVQIEIDKLPSIICLVAGAKAKMSAYDNGIYRMEKPYVITAGVNVIKTGFVQQVNIVKE